MKLFILALATITVFLGAPSFAQDTADTPKAVEAEDTSQDATYDERVTLAKEMIKIRPVREQVESAINQYAQTRPPAERDSFKTAMRNVFNIKALEKISTDAYVDTFTVQELRSMVEYYSKPEAKSATEKFGDYAGIVYPEIIRMLDRAAIRLKAGE